MLVTKKRHKPIYLFFYETERACYAFALKHSERSKLMLKSTRCSEAKRCYHVLSSFKS